MSQPEVQSQAWSDTEVVLDPPGVIPIPATRLDYGVLDYIRRIYQAQQIAGVSIPGGGDQRAGGIESRRLQIAEVPRSETAIGALLLIDLEPLDLETDRDGVSTARPLNIVLQGEVVCNVVKRARPAIGAPSVGRIWTSPGDFRKRTGRLPRGQSG